MNILHALNHGIPTRITNIGKYLFALLAVSMFATTASATVLYSNNFDGTVVTSSGISATLTGGAVESVQAFSTLSGFSGSFYRNTSGGTPMGTSGTATSLTLTGIGAHTSVSIGGLLAIIDSWDSSNGSCCSPDLFDIIVDGTAVVSGATFNTVLGTVNTIIGTSLTGGTKTANTYTNLGFTSWGDQAFNITGDSALTNIAHTAATLNVKFVAYGAGWQGGADESHAIENLTIIADTTTTQVPEPATLLLLGFGLAGYGFKRRKI